jgi:hypothetical protein
LAQEQLGMRLGRFHLLLEPIEMFGKEFEYVVKRNAKPVSISDETWEMIKGRFR